MGDWLRVRFHNLGRVLTQPWLLWALAALFWLRLVYLVAVASAPGDGSSLIAASRIFIHDPRQLYVAEAEFMRTHSTMPVHGWVGPPGAMLLLAPFALLPDPLAVHAWMVGDLVALAAGLGLLYALVRPTGWRRPLFALVGAFFPPVFADLLSGQWGGYLLLLAVVGMWLNARERPGWAGALAGAGGAIKLYPVAMLFGAGPRRLARFLAGLVVGGAVITVAGFAFVGLDRIGFWVADVLLATLSKADPDCAVDSPSSLVRRTVGGEAYPHLVSGDRLVWTQLPLHLPGLAHVLVYVLLAALVGVAVWAARGSGWHPVYGLSLGFALGALVPAEVNTYQMLPMLPLVLVTGVRAAELGRHRVLIPLAIGLLGYVRQPCLLAFPDIWTLAALTLFVTAAWNRRLFAPTV